MICIHFQKRYHPVPPMNWTQLNWTLKAFVWMVICLSKPWWLLYLMWCVLRNTAVKTEGRKKCASASYRAVSIYVREHFFEVFRTPRKRFSGSFLKLASPLHNPTFLVLRRSFDAPLCVVLDCPLLRIR